MRQLLLLLTFVLINQVFASHAMRSRSLREAWNLLEETSRGLPQYKSDTLSPDSVENAPVVDETFPYQPIAAESSMALNERFSFLSPGGPRIVRDQAGKVVEPFDLGSRRHWPQLGETGDLYIHEDFDLDGSVATWDALEAEIFAIPSGFSKPESRKRKAEPQRPTKAAAKRPAAPKAPSTPQPTEQVKTDPPAQSTSTLPSNRQPLIQASRLVTRELLGRYHALETRRDEFWLYEYPRGTWDPQGVNVCKVPQFNRLMDNHRQLIKSTLSTEEDLYFKAMDKYIELRRTFLKRPSKESLEPVAAAFQASLSATQALVDYYTKN